MTEPHNGATTHAVVLPRFGSADVLELRDLPRPQPQDDEVLVRVAAASVNPVDYKTRDGDYPPVGEDKLPIVLGRDLAGTIETCGTRAHNMLSHGDRVFALVGGDRGAQSDYVIVKAVELVASPANLDDVSAAAVPLAAMTAWQGIFDQGGLSEGQRVLIHGGAGGVGHMAVQLAKAKGAEVFATAGPDDLDFVKGLGADTVIDYKNQRFEDVAKDIDVVFDLIGGETQERSWAVVRKGGIIVSTVEAPDPKRAEAAGIRAAPRYHAEPNAAQLREVAQMIEAGTVKITVAKTFPLDAVAEAQGAQEKGGFQGKIVLTLNG